MPEAALHVTLVFLGAVRRERVGEVWEATAGGASAHMAPELAVAGLTGLPRRRPHLFALGLSDVGGRTAALQASITDALAAARLYEAERRRFWPHVTLARVRRGSRATHLASDPPAIVRFGASQLTLYRSRPGSDYEPLERLELPAN